MKIEIKKEQVIFQDDENVVLLKGENPIIAEFWDGTSTEGICRKAVPYTEISKNGTEIKAYGIIEDQTAGKIRVCDLYRMDRAEIILERTVEVLESGDAKGVRLCTEADLFPEEEYRFENLRYFAPPAIFDKNDLDEDGYEDYFHTQKTVFRDDRFNYPMFMYYSEDENHAIRIEREKLPQYDSIPDRIYSETSGEKASVFLQKTDIGSMGADGSDGMKVKLKAYYPFAEGDATIGLYIIKTVPFGAFWPMEKGEKFQVSYRFTDRKHKDFHDACWYSIKRVIRTKHPQPSPLPTAPEEIVKWRLESLNQYYIEKNREEDNNEPAGYVLNCHPQDGTQLENIIQYGFTGQNIMNALNVLRYGYEYNNSEYIRRGRKTADFFSDVIHIKESGMFYNLYNTDTKKVSFWWTGLLLPLAYANGEELEKLMGPLYEYRKDIIDVLTKMKGAYLRCMNEDVTSLLRMYLFEKAHGSVHDNWKNAIMNYAEFLLRTQEQDGSWYRAYSVDGKPMAEPKKWFGGTIYEQRSSTGTSITFLTELYQMTGDKRYLEAAEKAGEFVKTYIIDRVRFNGGVHDSIYAKGELIDNESILYPMLGMLSLYEETKKELYLEGALKAAHYYASWVCLWNVPLPENSSLAKYGFNSIGMGACDTCGAGYLHPFQLMGVAEMAQIAIYTEDKELFEAARLYWQGCSQTVELPDRTWGYARYGLQEEGYLISWWAADDPMFSPDTGFGNRLKGEGNKTCFPWINAVGVKAYWSLLDRFGTTDFPEIYFKYFGI